MEIKFRVWDKSERRFWYFKLQKLLERRLSYRGDWDFKIMAGKKTQYTGEKDKNGKEIYEGDIIQYKNYYATRRWWRTTEEIKEIEEEVQKQRDNFSIGKGQVEFGEGSYRFGSYDIFGKHIKSNNKLKIGDSHNSGYEIRYWDFEVIGNIFENPELLEY